MAVERYSIQYCVTNQQPESDQILYADGWAEEEFPSVSYFVGRLVELLDNPTVEIREFHMGRRKATLSWGGTIELP